MSAFILRTYFNFSNSILFIFFIIFIFSLQVVQKKNEEEEEDFLSFSLFKLKKTLEKTIEFLLLLNFFFTNSNCSSRFLILILNRKEKYFKLFFFEISNFQSIDNTIFIFINMVLIEVYNDNKKKYSIQFKKNTYIERRKQI